MLTDPNRNKDFNFVDAQLTLAFNFGKGAPEQPLDMDYYVDDLKLVKTNADGSVEELEIDFNDSAKLRSYGGYSIMNYITDNPFKEGDKLLHYDNTMLSGVSSYNGVYSFNLLGDLPFLKEEDWEVTANILAVGDSTPTDADTASYVRYKVFANRYSRIDPNQPAVEYMNKDGMILSLGEKVKAIAARYEEYYDCPVYVGELGAQYHSLDDDPNYLQWFEDIADIIKDYKINFTWHAYIGGGFGIHTWYPPDPPTAATKHERMERGFREYLFKQ